MELPHNTQFRVSVDWPSKALPVHEIPYAKASLEPNGDVLIELPKFRSLPVDFYLREFLNLELDNESILRACLEHGIASLDGFRIENTSSEQGLKSHLVAGQISAMRTQLDTGQRLVRYWANVWENVEAPLTAWKGWPGLRQLGEPADVTANRQPSDHEWADQLFAEEMNAALAVFSPSLHTTSDDVPAYRPLNKLPGLVAGALLQLTNAMIEGDGRFLRRCANCDVLMVRQRGRAQHGQYKRSAKVKYCQKACNDRAKSRRARAKQKAVDSANPSEETNR